jgi:o-succinylbenzoate---CoA ligase
MHLIMNLPKVHPAFKLNGVALDKQALLKRAQDLCNGGAPFEKDMGAFLLQWLNDGPTIQVQTSGATGTPKTISLKKEHMVHSAKATGTFFNAMEGTTALHCLPTKYIAGKMMLVRAMVLGWEVQYVQPDSSPLVSASGNFDFCAMVPLQLSNSSEQLKRLKTVIVGGAPMGMVLEDKVKELPTKIYGTYGMTETITHVAVRPVTRSAAERHPFQRTTMVAVNHPGPSLFQALPNVAFSQDHRGCLVVSAPGVAAE